MLVKAGADVNAEDVCDTPLVKAVKAWHAANVAALLECGADPRIPYLGESILEYAQSKIGTGTASSGAKKKVIKLLQDALAGKTTTATERPKSSVSGVPALWARIEKALEKEAPKVKASLQPGANAKQLEEIETVCKVVLPADFKSNWQIHDGQAVSAGALIPAGFTDEEYELLPIEGILAEWRPWKKLVDAGEFASDESSPDPGVRSDWWNTLWIPFASNGGGDSLCVDLAPADQGTVGQVISMSHESGERRRIAGSFAEFLGLLAEKLEESE